MTMATGAFAQGTFTVSGSNIPRGRLNAHADEAGGITLALFSGTIDGTQDGTVIIDYGVPVTNNFATTPPSWWISVARPATQTTRT